ncbi:hypothetical protein [Christiangramia sabulilitoris]|uniref:DUF4251 domain-containing protein n=1 Tax=Christiangramia sabulilitoris TaxID=2583991 RepID=A0A550I5V0_9FLAO|nr:hypothetical protein [Christiangramia sabulilitoris]TRO66331.1 hypothetical protein FGM01_00160 [Christiangramia sabulilitoris]
MKKHYYFNLFISILLLVFIGCSSDDDGQISEQFIIANVNGVDFHSDAKLTPTGFTRILMPAGRINLHVKALSADGNVLELLIDNFQGPGKYYFGDNFYNKSWVKFDMPSTSESWSVKASEALNRHTNFIEITSIKDNYIEGKIACDELINNLDGILGAMSGEFRLIITEQ